MRQLIEEAVEEEAEMDMTPMIDVVFLLIIFFLCIDFRILEAKLPAFLPKDKGAYPTDVEPQEKLNIRIVCENWGDEIPRRQLTAKQKATGMVSSFMLREHRIRWEVGPKKFHELDALLVELERIFDDQSKLQRNAETGELEPMGVVVEPGKATTYGDVALTLDAVNEAGFEKISFGGGRGARPKHGD